MSFVSCKETGATCSSPLSFLNILNEEQLGSQVTTRVHYDTHARTHAQTNKQTIITTTTTENDKHRQNSKYLQNRN